MTESQPAKTEVSEKDASVIALGCFDGVHLGHGEILKTAARLAAERGTVLSVWSLRGKGKALLCSLAQREALLRAYGAERVLFSEFSMVKDLSCEEFVRDLLRGSYGAAYAVCGKNFRFGKGRSGDAETLRTLMRAYGGDALAVTTKTVDGQTVSSTRIREALENGDPETATALLGRPFSIEGPVLPGKRLGRQLGFPTANQRLPEGLILPHPGVYVGMATLSDGRRYPCLSNIGFRPTVEQTTVPLCESYLYTAEPLSLYGEKMRVELLSFLRGELRFESVEALAAQVKKDLAMGRDYISRGCFSF